MSTRAPSPLRVNPAPFNDPALYCRELPLVAPAPAPAEAPAPGVITEVERRAERALEIGELVAEGLSPWALAGYTLSALCALARSVRASRR
jgi:hypothetical protein